MPGRWGTCLIAKTDTDRSACLPACILVSLMFVYVCDVGELKRTVDADGHAHVIASKKGGQAPDGPILRRNNPQLI